MNKVLKWILYILLGLVVLAVIAGFAFIAFRGFGHGIVRQDIRMMGPGFRVYGPMRFGFSPLGSIFGGLFGLGIFVLVIIAIVALVSALTRGNRPVQTPPPAQMTTASRTCSNCGKPAHEDWKTCPYCGNPLT